MGELQLRRAAAVVVAAVLACSTMAACGGAETSPVTRATTAEDAGAAGSCDWPMWGQNPGRTFASPCATALSPATVKDLQPRWFFNTYDVVTATPAVVDGSLYVGDWSGRFYAIDATSGQQRWTFQADVRPQVYAGQIVSSAAVADVGGVAHRALRERTTLYARPGRRRRDALEAPRRHRPTPTTSPRSSPRRSSSTARSCSASTCTTTRASAPGSWRSTRATGAQVWYFDPEQGRRPAAASTSGARRRVDLERRAVFVGTGLVRARHRAGGRRTRRRWSRSTSTTGQPKWAYQPHEPNVNDLDFAGAPNLFTSNGRRPGRPRQQGRHLLRRRPRHRPSSSGRRRRAGPSATGGFIGPTAYADGIVAGGHRGRAGGRSSTGFGPRRPHPVAEHPDAGDLRRDAPRSDGVLFIGGNDFTFRAFDLHTGDILWSQPMKGVVVGRGRRSSATDVYAVAGIREPGLDKRSETSGVYALRRSRARARRRPRRSPSTTTTNPASQASNLTNAPGSQRCIGAPCPLPFTLQARARRALSPRARSRSRPTRSRSPSTRPGSATPQQWLGGRPGGAATAPPSFGLFISESDDNPVGGLLCILDADGTCTGTTLPRLSDLQPHHAARPEGHDDVADTGRRPGPPHHHDLVRTPAQSPTDRLRCLSPIDPLAEVLGVSTTISTTFSLGGCSQRYGR